MHASTRNLLGALALTFALAAVNTSAHADALNANDPATSVNNQHSQQNTRVVTGTVVSSTSNTLILDLVGGEMMTFLVDSGSSVPSGLDAGSTVRIQYHEIVGVAGNTLHAANVTTVSGTGTSNNRTADFDRPMTASNATTPYGATNARQMPRTASPLALIGLAGLAAVALGYGIRRMNSR